MPVAARSSRRGDAAAAPHHHRAAGRERRRGHVDAAALVLERLAGLGPEQHLELLVGELAPPVEVDAVHLVLVGPVAEAAT